MGNKNEDIWFDDFILFGAIAYRHKTYKDGRRGIEAVPYEEALDAMFNCKVKDNG